MLIILKEDKTDVSQNIFQFIAHPLHESKTFNTLFTNREDHCLTDHHLYVSRYNWVMTSLLICFMTSLSVLVCCYSW